MSDCKTTKAFYRWLKSNSGRKVRIEDFRKKHDAPDVDWQRMNTALVASARSAGLIRSVGVTRDKYRSYKTLWLVRA